jgi:hypothetical protein
VAADGAHPFTAADQSTAADQFTGAVLFIEAEPSFVVVVITAVALVTRTIKIAEAMAAEFIGAARL